jgi:hypothetical protein
MNGVERIEELPKIESDLDPLTLAEFRTKYPQVAHVLERVSVETAHRKWIVQKLCDLNNSHVRNMEGQEETNALLRDLVKAVEDLSAQMAQVQQQSNENAKTILDWTMKFKSPLSILGAIIGVTGTALIGAWISRLLGVK